VRRVDIPKGDRRTRPLGIPTVADRVAQTVVKRFLEPLVEPHFHDLDQLFQVVVAEQKRRGKARSRDERSGKRRDEKATVPLISGTVKLVRASFNGAHPTSDRSAVRTSLFDIQKALSSDASRGTHNRVRHWRGVRRDRDEFGCSRDNEGHFPRCGTWSSSASCSFVSGACSSLRDIASDMTASRPETR
jgi:hypothetical protein